MNRPTWLRPPARPLYALFVLAAVLLGAWGFWPRAADVETASVRRQPLEVTFSEEGRTRLRDRFVVAAPVHGVVERITIEAGDAVTAGATVAVLRPAPAALLDPMTRADAESRRRPHPAPMTRPGPYARSNSATKRATARSPPKPDGAARRHKPTPRPADATRRRPGSTCKAARMHGRSACRSRRRSTDA